MATAAAPPPPLPSAKPKFVFINDSHPEDAKSKAKRKLVRAQAARGPHSSVASTLSNRIDSNRTGPTTSKHQVLKRSRKERANTTTFPLSLVGLHDLKALPEKPLEKTPPKEDAIIVQIKDRGLKSTAPPRRHQDTTSTSHVSIDNTTAEESRSLTDNDESSSSNSIITLVPKMPGTGWVSPFVSHPDPQRCYFPMLFNHYLTNLATDIPELDAGTPGILRVKWFPMVITSPATLYIVLLTAASHYAAFNGMLPSADTQSILLYLKQVTLTSINALIRDTPANTPMSDTIIGAVAKMASYEAMFGTASLYHTHMRGLQNMIKGRGGLHMLGLDGLLMRMVLWIDINSAFLLNSQAYFLPSMPLAGHVAMLQPNPGGFLGAS